MRTAIFAIAAGLASAIGSVANAEDVPKPPFEISIYSDKSGSTLATNSTRQALALTGTRSDPKQEAKLKSEATRSAAVETHTMEERVRIKERMQSTADAAAHVSTNSPLAIKLVSGGKSDESRKALLKRRLSELQAERRWIEEEEYSLRFAVLEMERNGRSRRFIESPHSLACTRWDREPVVK